MKMYYCHVLGGEKNFNYHSWLSNISISTLRNMGCTVKVICNRQIATN